MNSVSSPRITETQQRLWRGLVNSHSRIEATLEQALREAELPPLAWFNVLDPIREAPDQMLRPRDLGCGVQISRSGLTRLLDRMEGGGVITRKRCDEDRRGSYVGLTEAGEEIAAAMRELVETELGMILGDLFDGKESEQLIALLDRVATDDSHSVLKTVDGALTAPPLVV